MKLKFIGSADASVTYLGKYEVETGTVLENVADEDANILLQTGAFEVLDTKTEGGDSKKSDSSSSSSTSKDTKKDSK